MERTIKTPQLEFSVSTKYTPCDEILKSVKKGDARLDFVLRIPENEEYPSGYSAAVGYLKEDLIDSLPLHAEKISDDEVRIVAEPQTIKFNIKKQLKDYFLSDAGFELRGLHRHARLSALQDDMKKLAEVDGEFSDEDRAIRH